MDYNSYPEMNDFISKDGKNVMHDNLPEEENTTQSNTMKNFRKCIAIEQDLEHNSQNSSPSVSEINEGRKKISNATTVRMDDVSHLLIKKEPEIIDDKMEHVPLKVPERLHANECISNGVQKEVFSTLDEVLVKIETYPITNDLDETQDWNVRTEDLDIEQNLEGSIPGVLPNCAGQDSSGKREPEKRDHSSHKKVKTNSNVKGLHSEESTADLLLIHEQNSEKHLRLQLTNAQNEYQTTFKTYLNTFQNSEDEMLKCGKCDFQTMNRNSLMLHLREHNNSGNDEMFECDKCNYRTIYKHHLKSHLVRHNNPEEVQKFKCDQCSYESIFKCDLNKHILRHRNPNEVEQFKCVKCDYQTIHKKNLKPHLLRHQEKGQTYQCHECSFKTIFKCDIKNHLLKHRNLDEVERFKCMKCDFKTFYKQSLVVHLRRHNNSQKMAHKQ